MSTSRLSPIAFFGATGGCCNAALVLALESNHPCTALARTPSKLHEMLWSKGVSKEATENLLQVTKGDVRDVEAVKAALVYGRTPVTTIISGIGMVFGKNMDTTICQAAARSIVEALRALGWERKPHLVAISTTGTNRDAPRDVPILFGPLYHVMLAKPHADKRVMEKVVEEATTYGEEKAIDGWTVLRPSLLTSGKELGMGRIRVGTEDAPAIGYTVSRDDVGRWLFEELIAGEKEKWDRKKVSITY